MTRQLVSRRIVKDIRPIPNADRIEVAQVDGWECVVKKGEYSSGDPCLYFEIDSFLPKSDARFAFLMDHTRKQDDIEGARLRTVKLRGQISQGLLMRPSEFPELEGIQDNLAEVIGVTKWDPPIPPQWSGKVLGPFPSFIPKTDQERIQNIPQEELDKRAHDAFEVTIKLDGMSITIYKHDEHMGVCSRNLELCIDEESQNGNTAVQIAYKSGLLDALREYDGNIAIQGELMGPGIQGNNEKLRSHCLYVFDIWDIDKQEYLLPDNRMALWESLWDECNVMVGIVPPMGFMKLPATDGHVDIKKILDGAIGESSIPGTTREGIVYKSCADRFSFKAVSNEYLLKHSKR